MTTRKRDNPYHAVCTRHDDLLWLSVILAFGTKLVNALLFNIPAKAELTLYAAAGLLLAVYICLEYGKNLNVK